MNVLQHDRGQMVKMSKRVWQNDEIIKQMEWKLNKRIEQTSKIS